MDHTLPFDVSAREREIAELASALARELAPAEAEHDRNETFPLAHYERLHEAGYLRLAIPRDFGGAGASVFELVLAQERLAHASAALGLGTGMLFNLVGKLTQPNSWPPALVHKVLSDIATHGGIASSAVTEPELGSISRGGIPETTATPVPGGYRINGHKIFVTAAPALRYLVVALRLPPDAQAPQGYVAWAVLEPPLPGLRFEQTWRGSLSQRSGGSDDVWLEDVFVAEERMVERRVIGVPAPPLAPSGHWLTLVAVYLGSAQAAVEAAKDYARERVPTVLGQPIATQPHIQRYIGEMEVQLRAARALLYQVAREYDARPEDRASATPRIAAAKYVVTHAACRVTELALQVGGGFSLTRRLTLERHFRDVRGGLFQPLQDDLALGVIGRDALAR